MTNNNQRLLGLMRILSAIVLIAAGGIHLLLVFDGVGGVLGLLFVLNAIAGIVLGGAVLALRGKLLMAALSLSLLFIIASFLSLAFALTVGLFGITVMWNYSLVPLTFWVEGIGIPVIAITLGLALRAHRAR